MHHYLTAIGFEDISKAELKEVLREVREEYSQRNLVTQEEDIDYCEYIKEYSAGIGIQLFGDLDYREEFQQSYYVPFLKGSGVSSRAEVAIERRSDREAYIGICEDSRVSIHLIFHLLNTAEYLREKNLTSGRISFQSVTLSALANEGMILFPLKKDDKLEEEQREQSRTRQNLFQAAREGDLSAMEDLTLQDLKLFNQVNQRLVTEDVFSIVDTSMMPYGVESDKYQILGNIISYYILQNKTTIEPLYIMRLEVNDIHFDLCVPVHRVIGEPDVGRRFKGTVWLQGTINF